MIKLFSTLRGYKAEYLGRDIFAGIIIAAMTIPISMGYAEVAGLPAVYGLYGSVLPLLMFAMFSTSPQFIFGVDAAPAAIIGSALASWGITAGSDEAMQVVPVIALLTGVWLLAFWCFKAGRVVGFISTPVMGGFISGIALTIILMQVPKLLGSKASHGELFELLSAIFKACGTINVVSLGLGVGTLVLILVSKKLFPRFPMAIFAMLGGALLSYYGHIDRYGVAMLAAVEPGLKPLTFPDFTGIEATDVLGNSLTVAVVVMAETLLAENNFAFKNGYRLDDNSEILACGMGNIAASLTGCCSVNGSVSRTAMGEQFGGKTQLMSIVAAGILTVILAFGTGFIGYLPVPVLTAIVISALMGVVETHLAVRLFKVNRPEFWIFMGAMGSVLVLGTIYGVVIGIVLSFGDVVIRAAKPPRGQLGVIPGHGNFYDMARNRNAFPIEHVVIYRFSSNLFFANIATLQEDIENAIKADTRCVVLDAGGISDIDITAADRLDALYRSLKARNIRFYMTEHIGEVNDKLRKLGYGNLIEEGFVRRTITLALMDAGFARPYVLEGVENAAVADSSANILYPVWEKAEDEHSLHEYNWAFGDEAPERIERDVREIIDHISEKDWKASTLEESSMEHLFHNAHIWGGFGSIDEDELLRRLELHKKELAERLHNDENAIAAAIEQRRQMIARQLGEINPHAARLLKEHQLLVEKTLKKQFPDEYESLGEGEEK